MQGFPELQGFSFEHHCHDTPVALWIDLFSLFTGAYENSPVNDDLISRVYDYAAWCFQQPKTER